MKDKIKAAFRRKAQEYEEMVELCSTIAEENVFDQAPSKLDFYKGGIAYCKKIMETNLSASVDSCSSSVTKSGSEANLVAEEGIPKPVKRAKSQH